MRPIGPAPAWDRHRRSRETLWAQALYGTVRQADVHLPAGDGDAVPGRGGAQFVFRQFLAVRYGSESLLDLSEGSVSLPPRGSLAWS